MNFKQFLEVHDNFFVLAYSLGEMPRDSVQKLIDFTTKDPKDRFDIGQTIERNAFTQNFAWAVPCKEAIDLIKKYVREPLYDVLAGTGYWTKILKKAGINVIASDIHKISSKNWFHRQDRDTRYVKDISSLVEPEKEKIRRRNALKVGEDLKRKRIKGDIFISWPPCEEPFANDLLEMLPLGTRVFYIGEGTGGCTGDLSFHKNLSLNFELIEREMLPNFPMIHDGLTVWEKTKNLPVDPKYRGRMFPSYEEYDEF